MERHHNVWQMKLIESSTIFRLRADVGRNPVRFQKLKDIQGALLQLTPSILRFPRASGDIVKGRQRINDDQSSIPGVPSHPC